MDWVTVGGPWCKYYAKQYKSRWPRADQSISAWPDQLMARQVDHHDNHDGA